MTQADVDALSADSTTDAVSAELAAMHAIAAALARVRDPQARLRVLRWATDRFQPSTTAGVPPQAADTAMIAAIAEQDPALAVENLYDLFESSASNDTLDDMCDMFETPASASAALAVATPAPEPACEPRKHAREEPARLDTLVRGFASEFQRLAMEWQSA